MYWKRISLLLCVFGFLKDFRPSESFITDYIAGPWKNFTSEEVNEEIFPVATYCHFTTLIIVFLITDFLRYKPIILLCGLSGIVAYATLILSRSMLSMQLVQFFYGLFLSTEVAYSTYIYAKVDKRHYQAVTSRTIAACLVGRFMAGIVAQLTTSFDFLDYHQLHFITLSTFLMATAWAIFLPSVGQSIYFYAMTSVDDEPTERESLRVGEKSRPGAGRKFERAFSILWEHFLAAYRNGHVVKWSIWWAFATAGYLQVISYIQLLWHSALEPDGRLYNGAVDAIYTIISAAAVSLIAKLPLNWPLIGEGMLSVFSLLEGVLLLVASRTHSIWILYAIYIIFGIIYQTMVTVANFEVAKHISTDSYGLIFGINTLLALSLQSLLTAVVVNGSLDLSIGSQFFVYGGYYVVLGVFFLLTACYTVITRCTSGSEFKLCLSDEVVEPNADNRTDNTR